MGCLPGKKQLSGSMLSKTINTVKDIKVNPGVFVQENENSFQEVYQIGRSLGSGGFAEVRLATHKKTKEIRAVKIFRKDLLPEKYELKQEIQILKNLDHPNIIRIFEFFEEPKRFYIVMEYCRGGELFEEILKRQSFSEVCAAQIMEQLLSAVCYLHNKSIIHRDLKPENILLEDNEEALNIKLIDFGSATHLSSHISDVQGTCYYIPPEMIKRKYNEKCDLWSCGVVMYILLSGYPPFDGNSDLEVLNKVSKGEFSMDEWTHVSEEAKAMIKSLLCPAPERLSAEQALEHEWLASHLQKKNSSTVKVFENLKCFHSKNKLKDAVQIFIATQCVSQKDTKELKEAFMKIDKNKDGKLSREELLQEYQTIYGVEEAEREVNRIMLEVDTDKSGFIDYSEFLRATIDAQNLVSSRNLRSAFNLFDKNNKGKITANELSKVLEANGTSKASVWQRIIRDADINGDGEIDFEELEKLILRNI